MNDVETMTLRMTAEGEGARIHVTGQVDIATARAMGRYIDRVLSKGFSDDIIDLTAVTSMDSSGAWVLLLALRQAAARTVGLSLLCPESNASVRKVLDIVQIGAVVRVHTAALRIVP